MNNTIKNLLQAATKALNTSNYRELHSICQQILKIDNGQADAWFFLSIVAAAGRQIGEAIKLVENALKIHPGNTEYLSQKAKFHTLINQRQLALLCADKALLLKPDKAIVLDTLGVVYSKFGEHEKARDTLLLAAKNNTKNPQFQFNLASAEQFLGNESEAKRYYERAIELQPDFARSWWALSELEKNKTDSHGFHQLKNLIKGPKLSSESQLYYAHALSREYEREQDYDAAFSVLEAAKARRKKAINYSISTDEALFKAVSDNFTIAECSKIEDSNRGDNAIFVLGMPRSGTTLVERILDSHSQISSMGELQELALAIKSVSNTKSPTVLDPEVVASSACKSGNLIAQTYLQMIFGKRQGEKFFIDKMPLNFLCVGFIFKAFPAAKVVCLRRNPLDICLSNYRQLFALNFSYYNYHYDLNDTAKYYVFFDSLMNHWQQCYGERFYQLSYENLVENPETEVSNLLNYCGLNWEQDCLNFHNNKRAVATASTMQVRQPIYRSSIGRWKKYENQLQKAMDIFKENNIQF